MGISFQNITIQESTLQAIANSFTEWETNSHIWPSSTVKVLVTVINIVDNRIRRSCCLFDLFFYLLDLKKTQR